MQKAFFTDLDGTLLNSQSKITDGNKAAIQELTEAGHHFILATGRPLLSGIKQAQMLGLDHEGCYMIAFNGCILYDLGKKKILASIAMPLDVVRTIYGLAGEYGLHIQTYDENDVLVEPRCDDEIVRGYCKRILVEHRVLNDIAELTREPEKILVIELEDLEKLAAFREELLKLCGDAVDAYHSNPNYLEIVVKGMNKGKALVQMCERLGIPMEGTFAVGDESNDIAMIEAAHTGIAMANAIDEVKAAADVITKNDNDHDAIAEIIYELML